MEVSENIRRFIDHFMVQSVWPRCCSSEEGFRNFAVPFVLQRLCFDFANCVSPGVEDCESVGQQEFGLFEGRSAIFVEHEEGQLSANFLSSLWDVHFNQLVLNMYYKVHIG